MMEPLAGENKHSLCGSNHANSRATNRALLSQTASPFSSCFSRQVRTNLVLSTWAPSQGSAKIVTSATAPIPVDLQEHQDASSRLVAGQVPSH